MTDLVEKYEEILDLLSRPIAFHRAFVKIGGSVTAGVMLSQAFYWSRNRRARERGGWFYKSHTTWEEETGLTRREQQTARKHLRKAGLLEEKDGPLPGRGGGRVVWYRVNLGVLFEKLRGLPRTDTPAPDGELSADTSEVSAAEGCEVDAGSCDARPLHDDAQSVAPDLTSAGEIAQAVAPQRPTSLITSETTSQTTAEMTQRTRTHGARSLTLAPPPAKAGVGVSVEISDKALERYGRNQRGIRDVGAWVTTARRTGEWDRRVLSWCAEHGIDPSTGEPVNSGGASVDTSKCPDCEGRGWWYPEGFEKGTAKCRHPRLQSAA
ncbi:MAG TPA: hypothetical protein VF659_24150 [Pyrinomonadaceae bacterium]|jgi:hypothetical protein